MKILCYIGARGGSNRLKRKNIQKYGDITLLEHAINNALKSKYIDLVLVDSEDKEIRAIVEKMPECDGDRLDTHWRDAKLSGDGVSLYDAIKPVLSAKAWRDYSIIVILQVDTPVESVEIIDKCIEKFFEHENTEDVCTFLNGKRTGTVRVIHRRFFFDNMPTANLYGVEDRVDYVEIHTADDLMKANYYLENPFIPESPETFRVADKIKEPIKYNTRMIFNHFNRYFKAIDSLKIGKNDGVIDASCGQGYGTYLLSLCTPTVWGLDINKEYLKKAKEYYGGGSAFTTYDDFKEFPFMVNKIICIETIEHMKKEEQKPFIKYLLRYLKEGGDMFITAPLGKNKKSTYNKFHLCEPSLDFLEKTLTHNFNKHSIIIDNFVNSYGHKTEYCMISLYGYKGG